MANEIRLRADGVAGALSAALVAGATSMSSDGLADLPVVDTTDHAAITLFQRDAVTGRVTKRETVHVLAHGAGATTATILKGQESTADQDWFGGDLWVHGPTVADFAVFLTSPMIARGDLIVESGGALNTLHNTDVSGTEEIAPALTVPVETIVTSCDLTLSSFSTPVTIAVDIWASMNQGGSPKSWQFRVRRDNVGGAVLWTSAVIAATVDSSVGHDQRADITFNDNAPTTGHYVLTAEVVAGSTALFSDTRNFSVSSFLPTGGVPSRLPVGADGKYLYADSSQLLGVGWSDLLLPVLAADPSAPVDGQVWVNSTDGAMRVRVNGVTKTVTLT